MDGVPSPIMFKKWSAIHAVGSAVRRRVWTELLAGQPVFANLFVWLVGPPGTGKTQAIVPAGETLRKSETAKISPNDMSKQSLLDMLAKSADAVTFDDPPVVYDYHYMAIVIRELSNFMAQHDVQLAGILTDLFDNPPVNAESKRSGAGSVIVRPSISFIAGTATKNLGATIGNALWGQGFMSRIIMVYSADQPPMVLFEEGGKKREETNPELVSLLNRIGMMKGRMIWEKEAQEAFVAWYKHGPSRPDSCLPKPQHPKLQEYNARRFLHVTKLTMISALSDCRLQILKEDFERAKFWLEEAEAAMPEIFKEMTIHSDGEVLREMHMYLWGIYAAKKRAIPVMIIFNYLKDKVASREVPRLIETAENSGMIERKAGTHGAEAQYIPKATYGDIPE